MTAPLTTSPTTDPNATAFGTALAGGPVSVGFPSASTQVSPLPVSTTTLSNQNKINQVPGIINTTNNFAKTGVSTDASGNATYSNGTLVPQPVETPKYAPGAGTNTNLSSGGYVGDVYYAPGAALPLGPDGKAIQTSQSSPTDDLIISNLTSLKAQNDAITASIIDNIHAQYANLKSQQESINRGEQANVKNALLMGGVTGRGSSAQFAPISSSGIIQSQINYGLSKISDLTSKESAAVITAQQAAQQNNFQLMDKMNGVISKIRDEKVAAAVKLNDQIAEQNQKLAEQKLQAEKDNAVADLYSKGISDPSEILKTLKDQGLTITSKEVADIIKNVGPNLELMKFEDDKQKAAIKFALDNQITTKAYLIGNTIINTATGEKMTLEDFQRLTGQKVGLPQEKTDFSELQTNIVTPEQRKLAQDQAQFEANHSLDERKVIAAEQAANSVKKNLVKINGTDYLVDENGNLTNPKVPEATKQSMELKKSALTSAKELLDKFNAGKSAVGAERLLGIQKLPGTTARDFDVQFNNLKSLLSLDNVKLLKGQGQVSDAERQLLADASSKLDVSQSKGEFKKALEDIIKGLSGPGDNNYNSVSDYLKDNPDQFDAAAKLKRENPNLTDEDILQVLNPTFNSVAPDTNPGKGMRTDRHNNPTAFTTDIAKNAGLKLGVDYVAGDSFPNNPNLKTAKILGDPVETTIKVIDKIGFFTQSGKPRWTYVNSIPQAKNWDNLSYEQKKNVIRQMYAHEGGSQLLKYFA